MDLQVFYFGTKEEIIALIIERSTSMLEIILDIRNWCILLIWHSRLGPQHLRLEAVLRVIEQVPMVLKESHR